MYTCLLCFPSPTVISACCDSAWPNSKVRRGCNARACVLLCSNPMMKRYFRRLRRLMAGKREVFLSELDLIREQRCGHVFVRYSVSWRCLSRTSRPLFSAPLCPSHSFFFAHASISHLSLFSPAFLLLTLPTFSWRTYPTSHGGKRDPPRAPVHLRRANFDGLTLTVTAHSNNDETVWSNNKFKHNNLISILSQATPV